MKTTPRLQQVLIVDDQVQFAKDFAALTAGECEVLAATSGEEGIQTFSAHDVDLVLLDLKLGRGIDGLETLRRLRQIDAEVPIIIVTGHSSLETALQAGRLGATQYCRKAPSLKELRLLVEQHTKAMILRRAYENELQQRQPRFVGQSNAVRQLFNEITAVAPTDSPVLITGESGTGKELIAREIHRRSPRALQPLLTINCSNLSPDRFESEFFGHERGSFTGAHRCHHGLFEQAHNGTLFLDEIGDLPVPSQAKILRAIEHGTFRRLGGQREYNSDVRLLAATNHNLAEAIAKGEFRQDLFYRLQRICIQVPPLRERRDDIPMLAEYYLEFHSLKLHKPVPALPPDLMTDLRRHDWPGNIRELSAFIESVVMFSQGGKVGQLRQWPGNMPSTPPSTVFQSYFEQPYEQAKSRLVNEFQLEYFRDLISRCEGNYTRAAEIAGVNRSTIYRILNDQSDGADTVE